MLTDEQIGKNLVRLRGDMSQKELATAMRNLGFKWSQATVWSVEKGERPLRLAEAEALGTVFQREVGRSLRATDRYAEVLELGRQIHKVYQSIKDSLAEYDRLRVEIAVRIDDLAEADRPPRELVSEWITTPLSTILDEYYEGLRAEAAAASVRSGMSEEEWAAMDEQQAGTWLDRLNRTDEAEMERWVREHGERKATP